MTDIRISAACALLSSTLAISPDSASALPMPMMATSIVVPSHAPVSALLPERSTLALLLVGVGLIGTTVRHRRGYRPARSR